VVFNINTIKKERWRWQSGRLGQSSYLLAAPVVLRRLAYAKTAISWLKLLAYK